MSGMTVEMTGCQHLMDRMCTKCFNKNLAQVRKETAEQILFALEKRAAGKAIPCCNKCVDGVSKAISEIFSVVEYIRKEFELG